MKKIKRLMQVIFTSLVLFAASSTAVAGKKLAEIPKQFQGMWNNARGYSGFVISGEEPSDGYSILTLVSFGKNWMSEVMDNSGCYGDIIEIEELGKTIFDF